MKLWATVDKNGAVRVIAINKGLTTHASVTLDGLRGHATLKRLSAPAPESTHALTWGGQTFDDSPDGNPLGALTLEDPTRVGGTLSFSLAPFSAVLLTAETP